MRATALRARASSSSLDEHLVWETFQELDVAHEELRAAEEHVHAQADALVMAQRALDDERRLYRDLFESAPAPYLLTDSHGNILQANRCAAVLLRIKPALMAHRPLIGFLDPADRPLLRNRLCQLQRDDSVTTFELRIRPRRTHDSVRVSASASCLLSADGEPRAVRWLFQQADDSDPRRASALDQWLAVERELRERAEADALEKEQLLANVANRLRSSLSSIAGWLQVIGSGKAEPDGKRQAVASLTRNVRSLMSLVDNIVAKVSTGKDVARSTPVQIDLGQLLATLIEEYRPMAKSRGIRLQASIAAGGAPRLVGDLHRLRVAFDSLLGNALRFTSPGGAVLVTSRRADDTLTVTIQDSGCGIAATLRPSIADGEGPLEPLAEAPRAEAGGGLQLARHSIQLHGGVISTQGAGEHGGTTLTVKLPVSTPPAGD